MNYLKGDVVLLPYPFTDLKAVKVRPAVIAASDTGKFTDLFVVPLTSRTGNLQAGEFVLKDWSKAGLNVASALKRGCVLIDSALIRLKVGALSRQDTAALNKSLKLWLEL